MRSAIAHPGRAVLSALVIALLPAVAWGQRAPEHERLARARAQREQQQFESFRRRQLPITNGRSGSSECDVRLGRFCYWHDDGDDLPVEPERIAKARDAFLGTLDSLAIEHPTDPWIAGQRVRYMVEANRAAEAVNAALACDGSPWWCAALSGFANHSLGAYAAADSAFSEALMAMPEAKRCNWTDLHDILPDGYHRFYRNFPCAKRDSVNALIWWMADPRWSSTGNDLRTELLARLTMAELVQQARSAHDMAWGDDMAELMLRYGWPTAWSRGWQSATDPTRISVIGHEPSPSFEFVPLAKALLQPMEARLDSWTPLAERPTTRYAPAYAKHLREIEPQVAWFRRADSAAIVIGYDVHVPGDTVFVRDSVEAAAVISRAPHDAAVAHAASGKRRAALVLTTRRDSALLSVEVTDSSAKAFARARLAVRPPSDSAVSDLLLFDGAGDLPWTFDDAVARALGTRTVPRHAPFGVYWEVYGDLAQADSVTYSITVERNAPSLMRRFAERLRLAQPVLPVRMSFDGGRASASRSLLVDVSHIPSGRYQLTLRITALAAEAVVNREIEVR